MEWLGDPDPFVMWDDEDWCVGGGGGGTATHAAAQPFLPCFPMNTIHITRVCCARNFHKAMYFIMVTISTVGYGTAVQVHALHV